MYTDENKDALPAQKVHGGVEDEVNLAYAGEFNFLDTAGNNLNDIEKEIRLPDIIEAPVAEGYAVGEAVYKLNGNRIGSVSIIAAKGVDKAGYIDYLKRVWGRYLVS